MSELLIALLGVSAIGASVYAWRSRVEVERLKNRLERAAVELQSMQMAFSRFAPDEVIDQIRSQVGEKTEVLDKGTGKYFNGTLDDARVYQMTLIYNSNG